MHIKNLLPNSLKYICSFSLYLPDNLLCLGKSLLFFFCNNYTSFGELFQKWLRQGFEFYLLVSFHLTWLKADGGLLICGHAELFYMTSHNLISSLRGLPGTFGQPSGWDEDILTSADCKLWRRWSFLRSQILTTMIYYFTERSSKRSVSEQTWNPGIVLFGSILLNVS